MKTLISLILFVVLAGCASAQKQEQEMNELFARPLVQELVSKYDSRYGENALWNRVVRNGSYYQRTEGLNISALDAYSILTFTDLTIMEMLEPLLEKSCLAGQLNHCEGSKTIKRTLSLMNQCEKRKTSACLDLARSQYENGAWEAGVNTARSACAQGSRAACELSSQYLTELTSKRQQRALANQAAYQAASQLQQQAYQNSMNFLQQMNQQERQPTRNKTTNCETAPVTHLDGTVSYRTNCN